MGHDTTFRQKLEETVVRLCRLLSLATLLVLAPWSLGLGADAGRNLAVTEGRVALVIGNAKYKESPLRNPTNDARDMAVALRSLGFDVIEKTDATQKEMNRAISQFGERLKTGTIALFYYAGHGMQVKGKNFLIPVDAQVTSESSVRVEAVDVDAVFDQLGASPLNVIILDACRNNPFERRFRGASGGLAQMDAPKGSLIAYSTAPGKTAADGEGRNGLYTRELLKLMRTPGLPIEAVFKRVRSNVARATADRQIPWEASSLTGDFFFTRGDGPAVAIPSTEAVTRPTVPVSDDRSVELAYWDSIKDRRNPDDFHAYLDKFEGGNFVALARNRLLEIEQTRAQAARPEHPHDGIWSGELETYGGLFERPIKAPVEIRVAGGKIDGVVFMYGENRKLSGGVEPDGRLSNARITGSLQEYSLSGNLWQAHGEGALGWKLNLVLKRK